MYLLDTNVVSELRKAPSGKANKRVASWAKGVDPSNMYLSVISIMELEIGALRKMRKDPAQGTVFRSWMSNWVFPVFSGRMLDVTIKIARCAAKLHVPDPRPDRDALIAATAIVCDMTVAPRNVGDFEPTGVEIVNPWSYNGA